ncbi:MAG: hypothetical protein IPM48_13915 [Saprospiraceae bacterium]|nr:hypothetical protein [Saprospiraceae bacterium]
MRLLGQVPHANLIISIFKSNQKIIIKFEIGPFEQTYKFLETSQLADFDSASKLINEEWIKDVFTIFDSMNHKYKQISTQII